MDGSHVGPYRILHQIGRGGQATVFLAEDTRLPRQVALKVLGPGYGIDHTRLERFRREAEITSKLDHPGICAVYESGEDHGVLWIAMRYVDGESLADRIASAKDATESTRVSHPSNVDPPPAGRPRSDSTSGPTSWHQIAEVASIFEKTARTLHVAHEHNVIHRDMKPRNIMITKDGEPVVLDFGLAHELSGDDPSITKTGEMIGTPAYLSPEQIAGGKIRLDRRTDVYSLGVSLYECLTLERPFDADSREGLYQAILTKEPRDLAKLNPAIGRDLRVVVMTAIARDPDVRYQTALELADELGRVRRKEPINARPPSPIRVLWSWASRNRALAASLAALLLALIAGLMISLALNRDLKRALAEKEQALIERERLADLGLVGNLVSRAEGLVPAWPEKLAGADGIETWLHQARTLMARAAADPGGELAQKAGALEPIIPRIERRRAYALGVDQATIRDHAAAWEATIRRIADRVESPRYGGLSIRPQRGLIPLGRDSLSELEEFAIHGTGTVPQRGAEGRLEFADDSAIVLVLLPGAVFTMGARSDDVARTDAEAEHQVSLDPFFIGKHEVTQHQALLMFEGQGKAAYHPERKVLGPAVTLRHPVEFVPWYGAQWACNRFGLVLPTEAQWEYACRAGTTSPWAFGPTAESLRGAENVFDQTAAQHEPARQFSDMAKWPDGYPYHAPAGTFLPNPFGLYDMHGNVQEWCRDNFTKIDLRREHHRPEDGLTTVPSERPDDETYRVVRGGSHYFGTNAARASRRIRFAPAERNHALGFRVARAILP